MRKRLDVRMVEQGFAPSRAKAQEMIKAGDVEERDGEIWINPESTILKYVSRGGLKLEAALRRLRLDVQGLRCLDIGISTGGFCDCLLKAGAAHVTGVDVGHGQLNAALQGDPRVTLYEGVHVRDLTAEMAADADLCVVDVSFISLRHVIPILSQRLASGVRLLALIKPQFEVGPHNLGKGGVVRDVTLFDQVRAEVLQELEKFGFSVEDGFACEVRGQDGNQEFFVYAVRD